MATLVIICRFSLLVLMDGNRKTIHAGFELPDAVNRDHEAAISGLLAFYFSNHYCFGSFHRFCGNRSVKGRKRDCFSFLGQDLYLDQPIRFSKMSNFFSFYAPEL